MTDRCDVCGWPIAKSRDAGCVPGDCSMRPVPQRDDGPAPSAIAESDRLRAENAEMRAALVEYAEAVDDYNETRRDCACGRMTLVEATGRKNSAHVAMLLLGRRLRAARAEEVRNELDATIKRARE